MASAKRNTVRVGILTVSDTCSRKEAVDKSGPNLKKLAEDTNGLDGVIVATGIVPDEISSIKETLLEWSDVKELDLILTTGGTGFADRDVTPEATKSVLEKEAPGLAMVMLMGSLKITPLAVLSRSVCGIRKKTLIVNLPGSLKGSQECFGFVQPSLSHAIQLLKGERACVKATHKELAASGPQPINMVSAAHRLKKKKKKKKRKHKRPRTTSPLPSDESEAVVSAETWQDQDNREDRHSSPERGRSPVDAHQGDASPRLESSPISDGLDAERKEIEREVEESKDDVEDEEVEDSEMEAVSPSSMTNPVNMDVIMSSLKHIDDKDDNDDDIVDDVESPESRVIDESNPESEEDVHSEQGKSPTPYTKPRVMIIRRTSGSPIKRTIERVDDSDEESGEGGWSSGENKDDGDDEQNKSIEKDASFTRTRHLSPITTIDMSAIRGDVERKPLYASETRSREPDLGVFQFDPDDTEDNRESPKKQRRVIVLSRPFGKAPKQKKPAKKATSKKIKPEAMVHKIQAGKPLNTFLRMCALLKDITLSRGKRNVKRHLVTRQRGDQEVDTGIWKRGEQVQERNRVDDLFAPTDEGKKEQELIKKNKRRDEYVVAWYLWCPGHGKCRRKCGGYGACEEGCSGVSHKQDRHNCSVLVNLKLYLGDLDHWVVTITGQHVDPKDSVIWTPPPKDKLRHGVDVTDLIVSHCQKGDSLDEIHQKLMEDPELKGIAPTKRRLTHLLYNSRHLKTKRRSHVQEEENLPTVSHGHHNCQKIRHHDVEKVARRPRDSIYPVIPLKDALKIVMDHTPVLQPEVVDIKDALARVVSEEIKAPISLPPFRNSIKDGYAVLASDGPGVRQVMSDAIAGDAPDQELIPGHVIRITTGAPIPKGADAVVQVEDTELVEEADDGRREVSIRILSTPTTGQDIRPIGSDLQEGTMLVGPGTKLSPPELGLLASVGITKVKCYRRPVVGVCSTGNELTEPSEKLPPGHIYDSNRITMLATLLEMNVPTVDVGITPDTVQATKDVLLKAASQSDVIVTTGGVSMGEKDLLKYVLSEELKATLHFGRIFIKPGKPTTFCTFEYEGAKKLFFSLPGNPVSGIVTFNHFVLPCLRRMMGYVNPHLKRIKVRVMDDLKLDPRPEFQRAHLDWQSSEDGVPLASTTGNQISSRLISMRQANALLALPSRSEEQKTIPKGSLVEAVVLRI